MRSAGRGIVSCPLVWSCTHRQRSASRASIRMIEETDPYSGIVGSECRLKNMLRENGGSKDILDKIRVRCGQSKPDREWACDCYVVLSANDAFHEGFGLCSKSIVLEKVKGELDIVGRQCLSVVPGHARSKIHIPGLSVRAHRPARR